MKLKNKKIISALILIIFLLPMGLYAQDVPDSLGLEYAKKILQNVTENGNVSDLVDNTLPTLLPFGIKKEVAAKEVTIVLDEVSFDPNGGMLTAYTAIQDMNNQDTTLGFRVVDTRFTKAGFQGDARLELLNDVDVELFDSTILTFEKQGTYIDWDCHGFKELGVSCQISFDTTFIVGENPDGTTNGQSVTSRFQTQISSWDDLLVNINLPPFQLKKLPGFGFCVSNAVIDLSELYNSSGTYFPPNYQTPSMPEPNSPLWKGISIKEFSVKLPPEFKRNNSQERITFSAQNVLIDELGFTSKLNAYNLLDLNEGSANGWAFSLDTLEVDILTNQFQNVLLAGEIQLPIMDSIDAFKYSGFIDNSGNYFLNVSMTDTLSVPMWAAKMNLYDNSSIQFYKNGNHLDASATLNGNLTIKATNSGSVNIAGIDFQELRLQTTAPYLTVEALSLNTSGQGKLANFPVSLYEIGFCRNNTDIGINIGLAVNLVGDADHGFSADAGFTVWGELKNINGRNKYKYKKISFDEISIDIDAGAYAFNGVLNIYKEDPTFGNGFKGAIQASFLPGFTIFTSAQFGNVNDFRYWYVDGLLAFPTGIPLMQTGFGIYGFGGGAYYHMRRFGGGNIQIPQDASHNSDTAAVGMSLSGVTYVPDNSVFLGLKASTIIGTYPKPDAFNSMAAFEISFNSNGGVNTVGFQGDAYFMTPIANRGTNSKLYATTDIYYDFNNRVLHGQTSVYVNIPHIITGANPNNLAGTSTIHFEPSKWQITVGTPSNRVSLRMLDVMRFNSYFMIGNDIPDIPPLPANVRAIAGELNNNINYGNLSSGDGFIVGASLNVNIEQNYMILYGKFDAGCGFDFMLKNYGIGTHCAGSSEPLGFNGWFAQGQAYAYLQGNISLNISDGIFKGNYSIVDLAAAAVMQAKFPNPTWLQGNVTGNYSILGGLVEGDFNYQFTIGEQCEIISSGGLEGMSLIAAVAPADNSTDIDVFNSPQATFDMKINKVFTFEDVNGNVKNYRVKFDYFKVSHNGQNIEGHLKWNNKNDVVVFEPVDVLPGEADINLDVKVHFQQKINGIWRDVYQNGNILAETKQVTFHTGPAPDYIVPSNVAFSYPMKRQLNFYKNEADTGYIQLKKGQDYLFVNDNEWSFKGRCIATDDSVDFDFSYDTQKNKISFLIPQSLHNNEIYKFALVKIPLAENLGLDENVRDTNITISDTAGNNVNIQDKVITGYRLELKDKEIYSFYFRTSYYNTFVDKMNSMQLSAPWSWPIMNGVHKIGLNMSGNEFFDTYELYGEENFEPNIRIFADNNNVWFNDYVYPLIYAPFSETDSLSYPQDVYISWRDIQPTGLPPVRTSVLMPEPNATDLLSDENILQGYYSYNTNFLSLTYNSDYFVFKDYYDLKQKAGCSNYVTSNQAVINLLNGVYPSMLAGYPSYYYYKVQVKYFLPGKNRPSSSKIINIGY